MTKLQGTTPKEQKECAKQVKAWLSLLNEDARAVLSRYDVVALHNAVLWAVVRCKQEEQR